MRSRFYVPCLVGMTGAGRIEEIEPGHDEAVSANGLLLYKVVISWMGDTVAREIFGGEFVIRHGP